MAPFRGLPYTTSSTSGSEWYGDIETKAQEQIESEMEESIENHYDKIQ